MIEFLSMKTLNFFPKNHCFSKALIKWRGLALNGPAAPGKPGIDLSEENITELLLDIFGSLSFVEVCLLYQAAKKHSSLHESVDWKLFFQKQKLQFNSRNPELSEKLETMTHEFLTWAQERQMSSQDLMPMNSLDNPDSLNSLKTLTKNFRTLKLSRNEGKKILDLLVDLILMDKETLELIPLSGKDNWLQQLMVKRHPNTLNSDKSPQIKKAWPAYVQIKSSRQGDRIVHKLHLTYSNEEDLNSKLKRLSQMDAHV